METYGCSLNQADSEIIAGILEQFGIGITKDMGNANYIIFNGCSVKKTTENRMLNRLRKLLKLKNRKTKLVVFGCLAKINRKEISELSEKIILIKYLKGLGKLLDIKINNFDLEVREKRKRRFTSIIPICRGCLGECTYCAVRTARGELKSYKISEINKRFKRAIAETPEIWLTAQDTGAYGKDVKTNLPKLLKELLENEGCYRVRIGMMNPHFLKGFYSGFKRVFKDERIYKFVHLPVQAGSNTILKKMRRKYCAEDFVDVVKRLRADFPDVTIATDVIAGFPGEGENEFEETVKLIKKAKPDIVNISRYGDRPGTRAGEMGGKVHGRISKERSRELTKICAKISKERNRKFTGKRMKILVTEKGVRGNFVGRAENYKPVVIKENKLGEFVDVKIVGARETYLVGKIA